MSVILESLINAFKDLFKCLFVDYINVENKMLNASIHSICVIILNVLISPMALYIIWRKIQPNNPLLYEDTDFTKHKTVTWYVRENKYFNDEITKFLSSKFKLRSKYSYQYDSIRNKIVGIFGYHDSSMIFYLDIPSDKITPVYCIRGHIIGVLKSSATDAICVAYDDEAVLFEFLGMFRQPVVETHKDGNLYVYDDEICNVFKEEEPLKSIIYDNYTFDNYISTSIDDIKKSVEHFKRVNDVSSVYELSNNYNLGIMLYGEPGTGKTLLMKTICNELKRNARIFKLHKQLTPSELHSRLVRCVENNEVIILDEFDFDATLISRSPIKRSDHVKELINRRTRLLMFDKPNDQITDELGVLKKQISLAENKLEFSAILTALDGMHEQRGRVIIACTNTIENIDLALLRPGRFDIVHELKPYNSTEVGMYLSKFYNIDVPNGVFKSITPANLRQLCKLNTLESAVRILTD